MVNSSDCIKCTGILPIINIERKDTAELLVSTLLKTGICAIEILCRNDHAIEIISDIKKRHPEMAVGAGTVLTVDTAKEVKTTGADFIVFPGYDQQLVDWCNFNGVFCIPGTSNASEIQAAYNSGLRIVKFFPSEKLGGLKSIETYAGVFKGMQFLPTGGITFELAENYLKSDAVAAIGGSLMAPHEILEKGDFVRVEELCKKCLSISLGFSLAHIGINANCDIEAKRIVSAFSDIFLMPTIDKGRSYFSGDAVEVFKKDGLGRNGHIGFKTNNIERAIYYLKSQNIGIIPETIGYTDSGTIAHVYLDIEIGGFAIHLCL